MSSASAASADNLLARLERSDTTPAAVFSALLGENMTPEAFFNTHWEKSPLHVQRRSPSFYHGLFSKAAFDAHVRRAADTMQYGFDLNVCVCSEEGKKIDMNPPKQKQGQNAGSTKASLSAAPSKPSKAASSKPPAPSKPTHKPSAAARAAIAESEGVQTMTIAEALALASASKAKLKPQAAAEEEEESEEEEDEEMEEAEEQEEDEDVAMDEDEDAGEEEELLDGTSVSTIKQYAPVTFDAYDRLYNSGCTVQALQPQQYTRPMHQLVSHLEDLFGGLVGANCYLTPANSQGLAPHHDDVEVFVLQLEGTKAWKLYTPKMTLPREHSGDFAREELSEPMQVVELKPGDMMYLPRGVIHEARTDAVASSHMTISVYQKTSFYDLLSSLLPRALEKAFYDVEAGHEFRKGLPVGYLNWMGTGAAVEGDVDMQAETGLSPAAPSSSRGSLRSSFFSSLSSLLDQMKARCEDALDEVVDEMAEDFVQSRLPPPPKSNKQSKKNPFSLASSSKLEANDKVRLVHASAVRMVVIPASEEENDDDEDDGDGAHLILTHSLSNSSKHHLDGRFPPPSEEELLERQVQLPIYYAPTITQLMRAGRSQAYLSVSSLRLDLSDMLTSSGLPPSEEDQLEAKRELVQTLVGAGMVEKWEKDQPKEVQQKPSAMVAAAAKQSKKPLTAGQLLKQKANTASAFAQALASSKIGGAGGKRPASEVTSSAAAASSSHKQKQHNGNGHKTESGAKKQRRE